jgi:hypothetical protein
MGLDRYRGAGNVWTLLQFRRLVYPFTRLFPQHRQQTPPPPNLPTNHNEVFRMGTLMVLSVFAIVPIIDGGVIGTCDRMHCCARGRGVRLSVQCVTVVPVPGCLLCACREDANTIVESTVHSSLPRNECRGQRWAPSVLSSPTIPAVPI